MNGEQGPLPLPGGTPAPRSFGDSSPQFAPRTPYTQQPPPYGRQQQPRDDARQQHGYGTRFRGNGNSGRYNSMQNGKHVGAYSMDRGVHFAEELVRSKRHRTRISTMRRRRLTTSR
jgi:hypothetical protein